MADESQFDESTLNSLGGLAIALSAMYEILIYKRLVKRGDLLKFLDAHVQSCRDNKMNILTLAQLENVRDLVKANEENDLARFLRDTPVQGTA
jgi:hypothetical protein